MRCPSCHIELPDDAISCPSCATSLDDVATRKLETPKSASMSQRTPSYDSIDDARFVPGTILAERYRIVGLLGKGGMGEVYRADDLKLSQPVALKFLPDRLLSDGASLARFHREVRIARQVSHKNVCRVYDIGEIEGHHFLSMEYIKGEELSSLLRRIGRLPPDKALQLARQICAGLAAAHDASVLHRDLKPSNVMIDGDGNARILDFGIAGLRGEFGEDELVAGTPGYMAPEQLEGRNVTVRSDIYSLGLVLYELFTGKRAFEATNFNELIKLRLSDATPTNPTSIVKDLDPLIERVIERCIDKDPAKRPASALQVAAALPGGDPIAAALAAGETPSPEMVAAAPKSGTLRPVVALSLLGSVLVFLVIPMLLSKRVALHRMVPLEKPPEVLKEQASQIAKSFGYTTAPADVAYSFRINGEYASYIADHRSSMNPWETLKNAQPTLVYFWYRQSPTALVPYSEQTVGERDPPVNFPGMILLGTDTQGQLIFFEAVPEQVSAGSGDGEKGERGNGEIRGQGDREKRGPGESEGRVAETDKLGVIVARAQDISPSPTPPVTPSPLPPVSPSRSSGPWSILFHEAGLDPANFQPTESLWTPPHAYDARQAWSGVYPSLPQVPIRIEAASYRGRPVYFEIVSPWSKPEIEVANSVSGSQKVFTWLLLGIFFVTMGLAAFIAVRNLRAGRGDRRGAFRVALWLFVLRMFVWAFATHHVAGVEELLLLVTGLQSALFWSWFVGLLYLALEPYLRRRWPERIISWNRLVAGDFRDPMVGRDILVGAVVGCFCITLLYLKLLLPQLFGLYPGMPRVIDSFETPLAGISTFLQLFGNQLSASLVQSFMIVFLLLFLSLLLRRDWLGITGGFLILSVLFVAEEIGQGHPIASVLSVVAVGAFVFCAARFGPLTLMSMLVFFHLWVFFPITTELTAWYATIFVLDAVVLLALAVYGYYISLGGQSPFGVKLLAEE